MLLLFYNSFIIEEGFYVPGVAPVDFKVGEQIEVKVCCFRFLIY